MSMNFFRKICFGATLLLFALPMVAATIDGGGKIEKKVWQDSDPNKENYFNNRRALVGPGCVINSLFDGIEVVSGTKDLQNICNDDLDDYATIPALVGATVVASPIISIKDNQHYYAGGTEAGFVICAKSNASILTLDLAQFYKIQFLKDGEKVGDLQPISTGKSVTGLGLSLLTFPGSDQINKLYMATAPGNFDEIKLVQCGVDAKLLSAINIKYAFVGKAREYTITNNKQNGIAKYSQEQKRGTFTLDAQGTKPTHTWGEVSRDDVIDEKLDNGYAAVVGAVVPVSTPVTVVAKPSDGKEAFPKGTEVGFKFNGFNLANLSVGSGVELTLFNKENKQIGKYDISNKLLGLGLIEDTKDGEVVMRAPAAFSAAKIFFKGIGIEVGGTSVNYAFVRMAPELASHHCPIEVEANRSVCGCENEFTLQHNGKVAVDWSIVSQPADAHITLDAETGKVSNIYLPGDYTFRATAEDECFEETTIHYAPFNDPVGNGVTLLVNGNSDGKIKYELSDKVGAGLLHIFAGLQDASNILSSKLNAFAYRDAGVELAANTAIVGVKSVDGSNLAKDIKNKMNVGFVVSSKGTGLKADVLKLYNIRLYKNGNLVDKAVATHWDAISAGLVGKEDAQKMRLSIDVPAGADFDEVVLYNTGLLSADLDQLNIYYAYVSDATQDNPVTNVLYGAETISSDLTHATIDWENTKMFNVANVGNGIDKLGNLLDGDLSSPILFPLGVNLGGATIAVNIGKIVNPGQNLTLVTDQWELGLGANLSKVLKVITYLDLQAQDTLSSWKLLGADVIGTGGKGYAMLKTEKPFNKIRITQIQPLSALTSLNIGGLALVNDVAEDDADTGCTEEYLVLDEDCPLQDKRDLDNATLVFHRTFQKNKWNSLILPVSMTKAQLQAAFGDGVQIARFDHMEPKWIVFSPVTEDVEGYLLQCNTPYIIYPTKDPQMVQREYNVGGEATHYIDGAVYSVTGISYRDETANLVHSEEGGNHKMIHYGSYDKPAQVPSGSYILRQGNLVHTATVHKVKSYRTWLQENTPSDVVLSMSFAKGDNEMTAIKVVEEAKQNASTGIYSVSGMRMDGTNIGNLPKGVYIINNKKVIVNK